MRFIHYLIPFHICEHFACTSKKILLLSNTFSDVKFHLTFYISYPSLNILLT
jgi:hypothetical protein